MKVLVEFFKTTNVNSGDQGGLKRLLKHAVPLSVWIGCGNHKLALCFKHLLGAFPNVSDADSTLLAIWKFFHYRPVALNFLQDVAAAYLEHAITLVCPSVTRWPQAMKEHVRLFTMGKNSYSALFRYV